MNRNSGTKTISGVGSVTTQITTQIFVDPNAVYLQTPASADAGEVLVSAQSGTKLATSSDVKIGDVVTTAGAKTLTNTLQTDQVSFTQPKELVTKQYVDTTILPALGAVKYAGTYNASLNLPDLVSGGPYAEGQYYIVSVAGTQLGISPNLLGVGDWIIRSPQNTWEVIEDPNEELVELKAKTNRLDTNAQQTAHFLPATDDAVDIGEPFAKRFKSCYFSQNVESKNLTCSQDIACLNARATQALRSNVWYNLSNSANVELQDTASGEVRLAGSAYAGKSGQVLQLNPVGTLVAAPLPSSAGALDVKNDVPINKDQTGVFLDKAFNLYGPTDKGFPQLPTPTNYLGTVHAVTDEGTFNAAYSSAVNGDVLSVSGSIAFTSEKTIAKSIILVANTQGASITLNTATVIFTVSVSGVRFQGLTLNNPNTGSSAGLISFTGTANTGCEVSACRFETNEAAIYTAHSSIVIRDNNFVFLGTPDSHRYIFVLGCLGNCFIVRNVFHGNGTSNTQCVILTNSVAANYLNGSLIISENTTATAPCQRLLMIEIPLTASNFRLLVSKNTITASDFIIHYSTPALDGVKEIWLVDNTHVLNPIVTASKGLLGIDTATTGTISLSAVIYASGNTIPPLRADYSDLIASAAAQPNLVTYANTKFTPASLFNVIIPFITSLGASAALETRVVAVENKTQRLAADGNPSTKLTYPGAQVFTSLHDIPNKAYVDGAVFSKVDGPTSSTDEAIARFDTATGKLIQSSSVTLTDSGIINGATGINLTTFALVQGAATTFEGSIFRGNNFLDPSSTAQLLNPSNVGVAVRQDGGVRCTAAAYTGNSDRAVTLATDGTLQKSGATISAAGVVTGNYRGSEYLDTQGVNGLYLALGPTAGIQFQNIVYKGLADRVCSHDADGTLKGTTATISAAGAAAFSQVKTGIVNAPTQSVGLTIADSAAGSIALTGTDYAGAAGKLLYLSDATGRLSPLNLVGPGTLRVDANGWVSVLLDTPALVTPHNLTGYTSDLNFTVSVSGTGNSTNLGYMVFDGFPANLWYTAGGLFIQTGPNNAVANSVNTFQGQNGPWLKITLNTQKRFNNFRYWWNDAPSRVNRCRIWGSNDDVAYTVFYDNINTGDLPYANPNAWESFIPFAQQTWRYIVFQITGTGSNIGAWDTYASVVELDFAQI